MNPGCAAEQHAWREVKDGWCPLYGDVDKIGVAIEWHDFRTEHSFNWGRTFHPRSLEFCLNLDGRGAVGAGSGAGLDGLAERVHALGGTLEVGPGEARGFRLRVRLGKARPQRARAEVVG